MRCAIRVSLLLALATPALARADAVDNYIQSQMRRQHIPGLSLAVVVDGKVVKAKGYGLSDIETDTPATPETVYQLASVTKQFTAAAVLILVQDGKLNLDDPIQKFIEGTPDIWAGISVAHLLNHTSGIKDYLNELNARSLEEMTPKKIVDLVIGQPLNFAPGEKYSYSNTGYVMLGMIVNKMSGMPYDVFLTERVFKPLGMDATRRSSLDVIPNRAAGYTWVGDRWQNSPYLNPTLWDNGDGGMLSTVLDLAKWDAALYGEAILNEATKQKMWSRGTLKDGKSINSGFGWGLDELRGHRLIEMNGSRPGTTTNLARYVDDKVTVIVLLNCDAEIGRISCGVARHFIPSLNFPKPITEEIAPARLAAYTGRYEFANNFMLTINLEDGRLVERSPKLAGGFWSPVSETTFLSEDLPIEMTFDLGRQGEVVGLTWRSDLRKKTIPRIGPLIHDLKPQADPDPERTGRVRAALESFAKGGQAVEQVENLTPGAKKDFGRGARSELAGLQSLTFISQESIGDRGIERHGEKVAHILYYKFTTPKCTRYLLVHLTAGGLLTDMDIVDD
ncbi:serine hydrolase [Singulisphaera acidiphila]|uniref:Penicillin-binding protein, beta-lactamase class C n=1 Tax=Singulisphaera acidiphila (strain ATCC BAA-1392 / DSM 18658 / VKM B-2454 / MOB10) TaxID=886293 RepID=L0DFG2_SINAD|nr:serine hydrolase [Singulisphaera acidiphila]AGA27997.1 penicillin-binding protein, beta-lactamase class C [Singulisphaera acidiphila DSM 18658]